MISDLLKTLHLLTVISEIQVTTGYSITKNFRPQIFIALLIKTEKQTT